MFRSPSRTSTNTGVAPQWTITLAVAGHVIGEVITSSPGSTPSAISERCSAAVPDASASTCFASRYSAIRRSSSAARGPVVSQPDRSVSATAAISSSPTAGGWKPSIVSRLDESFDIHGLESNRRFRPVCTPERFLAAVSDGEDGAGAIGPAPKLVETMAPAPVGADAADALPRVCLLDTGDLAKLAGRWDEETDTGTADVRNRRQRLRRNLLAQRRRQRRPVQVDAERDPTQLRVVAPAEAGRELADARPVGPDQHLRVARAVRHADCGGRGGRRFDDRADLPRLELTRPHVRQRDAERRQRRRQPIGHRQRLEVSA